MPFEAKSNLVEVRYLGLSVLAITQTVAPGIFVLSDGTPAIEHGEALSLVTPANPAAAGEVIIIYVTGLGLVNPPVATGAATGTAAAIQPECIPPLVNAGEILYEGLTPGFVGLYQMRVRVSPSLPSGNADLFIQYVGCWLGGPPLVDYQSSTVKLPVQ